MVRFTVDAYSHERFGWVVLPLQVHGVNLNMVLNTGLPFSAISEGARDDLLGREILPPVTRSSYILTDVTMIGTPLSDLLVRVRRNLTQFEVDGILGLDFLRQFTEIHFEVASYRLTLTLP